MEQSHLLQRPGSKHLQAVHSAGERLAAGDLIGGTEGLDGRRQASHRKTRENQEAKCFLSFISNHSFYTIRKHVRGGRGISAPTHLTIVVDKPRSRDL